MWRVDNCSPHSVHPSAVIQWFLHSDLLSTCPSQFHPLKLVSSTFAISVKDRRKEARQSRVDEME